MSNIPVIPLDYTATALTNKIIDVELTLPNLALRAVAVPDGPYYVNSMVIWDEVNQRQLVKGVDWSPVELHRELSSKTGIGVYSGILIQNSNVAQVVKLKSYQVVGGEFTSTNQVVMDLINKVMNDNRQVYWNDLLGIPQQFPPSPHRHDAGDLYGLEYLVDAINELTNVMRYGDDLSHQRILQYVDQRAGKGISEDRLYFLSNF